MNGPRYALYYVPSPEDPLYRLGSTILGYDAYSGATLERHDSGNGVDWDAVTRAPRKYGFHATLKAPFHLAPLATENELVRALESLARECRDIPLVELEVRALNGFLAAVPRNPSVALNQLAANCVVAFDRFRAPLTGAERRRRITPDLSPAHRANLDQWGYPYVFDQFRFHMTLTDQLGASQQRELLPILQRMIMERCGHTPISVDRLTLLRQGDPDDRFKVIACATMPNVAVHPQL